MSETQLKDKYVKTISSMLDGVKNMNNENDKARLAYKIFDYIIKYKVLEYNFATINLKNVILNKLLQFENEDIPGEFNPKEWAPIVKQILFHV